MVSNRSTVSIKMADALRFITGSEKALTKSSKKTVNQLAYWTRDRARELAPHDTNKMRGLITAYVNMDGRSGPRATVWAKNPTADDGHPRKISNFNLVRWFHESPNARSKSGKIKFMTIALNDVRRKAGPVAVGNYNKIKFK